MDTPALPDQRGQTLPRLVAIMQRLLSPTGCPWDREQTHHSLKPMTIEEAYEVVEAIDHGDATLDAWYPPLQAEVDRRMHAKGYEFPRMLSLSFPAATPYAQIA